MITEDFKIFNQFEDSIIVANENMEIIFSNYVAKKFFNNIKNFSKIKKYFIFGSTGYIADYDKTVIDLIFESKQNFYTICTYQATSDDYYNLEISSIRVGNFIIIKFKDITQNINYNSLSEELNDLKVKYNNIVEASSKIEKIKEQAQQHALQNALINRVFAKIRTSENMDELLQSVLYEIHELLGAYKTYYVDFDLKNCVIKLVSSTEYANEIDKKIQFDKQIIDSIKDFKIYNSVCMTESLDSENILRRGTHRVVIPISDKKKTIGAIVVLTVQSSVVKANLELLQVISEQLTGAVIRTLLTEDIKKQNKKLKNTLKELEETQLQLINSEKLASLGQLIAGVAHEINTPLGSINSNNEMFKRIIEKNMLVENKEVIKDLNEIDSEAIRRITNIVKSLKKFVRLDEEEQQPADINKEIDLTLQLINHEIKNKVTIIKKYSKVPSVYCYVNMLNQVFMNLLVNACHSIKEKGEIIITTGVEDNYLRVSIKDNGEGISEKNKSKIFNVGFTTKGIGAGTGLGLAISQKIILKHKGSITFTSKEGEGTEFVVRIPCS
jgi:signal transduction histidine kinase